MLKNYLKIAYRNILKNKGTTLINAFGMALAIGCCMLVYEFIHFSFNTDEFHSNRDEIYVIQRQMDLNGEHSLWSDVPQELGTALKKDFHQVADVVRVNNRGGIIKYGDKVFNEGVSFVDDAYFTLFDFPIKWGDPSTFSEKEGIVLTAPIAQKYFSEKNPIGETLTIRFKEKGEEIVAHFTVKGVLEKIPVSASFRNEILVPFSRQNIFNTTIGDWTKLANPIFIQIKDQASIQTIKASEKKYLDIINAANEQWKMSGIHFQPLNTVTLNALYVRNAPFNGTLLLGIYIVGGIGIFLLLMACFNYLNIALASAGTRLKEISVRKVMGGTRRQIIYQFLLENFLICTMALCLGLLFAHTIFLPWFNALLGSGDIFKLSFLSNPETWLFTIALLLFVTIAGAGYPAFYISKYQPVAILKKEFKLSSKSGFQKTLIGAQLFLSILTIFFTFGGLLLNNSINEKEWGYNQNDIAVVQLEEASDFKAFKADIVAHPDIIEVTGSAEPIGRRLQQLKAQFAGEEYNVEGITIAPNYLNTLEIPLIAGRQFDARQETDQVNSILVNETFRKVMNWDQAVGRMVRIADQPYRIIGEVQDVYQTNFVQKIQPLVFKMGAEDQFKYVSIRTQSGTAVSTAKALAANWKRFYPNAPYTYFFQDNAFWIYFNVFNQGASILSASALMTILICIIGLFGMAMLLLNRKMKEISIRKVLGASKMQVAQLVQKDFFIPLCIALVLALPIGSLGINAIRDEFAPSISIGALPFLLTIGSIFCMVVISLSKHVYTAIRSEPSQFLRDE